MDCQQDSRLSYSEKLARFCSQLQYDQLPAAAIEKVKHCFVDYLAIAFRASCLDSSQPVRTLAKEAAGLGKATLLGWRRPTSPYWAAFANGMAAHSLELDDTYLKGSIHNESFLYSTALACAEEHGLSGKRFVEAIVAGFEVACRLAEALQPAVTNARGFHPTGTCGVVGAAAAAGKLLALNETQFTSAIGIACSQASGLLEFVSDGSWTKRFHAGWAAHGGLTAAGLAKHGMTGPRTVLEGPFGFLHAYSGQPKLEGFDQGLGQDYKVLQTAMKYYPCNYYIQAVNDSVHKLNDREDLHAEEIAKVVVYTVRAASHLVCEPIAQKRNPRTMIDAQFSVPFNVALGFLAKRVTFSDFNDQMYQSAEIQRLMNLTSCEVDPVLDAQYPETWPARVEITLKDGRMLADETQYAKGDPRNPLTQDEVITKHKGLVSGLVDDSTDDQMLDVILRLEQQPDLSGLSGILQRLELAG